MPANPFATSEAQKAANLAHVRRERDALDEIRGFGNEGVLMETAMDVGEKLMDVGEQATESFERAVEDLGTLAAASPSIA